jgi:diadenosine tetraphosphatase ApaH/serine/threonine PP2A family protein phosphatase
MRYGIFSDIHGNLEALEAILARLRDAGAEKLICLGDLVGYGASPNECVEAVRGVCDVVLPGNHDSAVVGETNIDFFNPFAREAVLWTRRALKEEHLEYLRGLTLVHTEKEIFRAVHATPCSPEKWDYILGIEDARLQFECFHERVCFVGHSHQPFAARRGPLGEVTMAAFGEVMLASDARYILNVGSVGQPRDGDPRGACAVLEDAPGASSDGEMRVVLHREMYDLRTAQEKIIAAGLPSILASRLEVGQ